MQLDARDGDVAAHRQAVDHGPAHRSDVADEALAQRQHVVEEPVGPVGDGAIAGGCPGDALGGEMAAERRDLHGAAARAFALVAVGVDHQAAVPVGRAG